ncbi:MAG: hypothetical protein GY866_35650 [Proteobacteria bacterium]|nr:hypothetical protein [Pseudomonadota bacterium]
MIRGSIFAKIAMDNEVSLKVVLANIYKTAFSILKNHPLYEYFEKYLGGFLIVMDPDGKIITAEEDDALMDSQRIGYVHPLEREKYYGGAVEKARKLLKCDKISSFSSLPGDAGAVKINDGLIFSFSGFEFLELKEHEKADDYRDIFETINLYTLLTFGFFDPEKQAQINPYRYSLLDTDDNGEILREEIIFSLSSDELTEIATEIKTRGRQFNFGLLNEIFISKVLLETGFIDSAFAEEIIKISNNRFVTNGMF